LTPIDRVGVLTPDQKPFYGGTYFPNNGWKQLLQQISDAFTNNRAKIDQSAESLVENLQLNIKEKYKLEGTNHQLSESQRAATYDRLAAKFDKELGGIQKSPKFPMPSVWQYLAIHGYQSKNDSALDHLEFTLEKIANGGIYDHIGGGFARYSVDEEWHVPHFEKMLYDNGQLLSLYANGFKLSGNKKFKKTILETIEFLKREMLDQSGGFYSALDADSEGEEGKFYVWQEQEIKSLVSEDHYDLVKAYYDVSAEGNWEGKNVLRVVQEENDLQKRFGLDDEKFDGIITNFKAKALAERSMRIRPGLDDKIIAGWNGLALSGLCDAYQAIQDRSILELVIKNATFIKSNLVADDKLMRFPSKDLEGFLEDYAAVIQSFIKYYETTSDVTYLNTAKKLLERVDEAFFDESENLYFFTSDQSESLIARKKEFFDNVIPSSNSIMAWNLVHLGTHYYDDNLINKGQSILAQVTELIQQEPEYMSNWAVLALELSESFAEIVIVGPEAEAFRDEINKKYLPGKIISSTISPNDLPIFEYKEALEDKTTIYVCFNKSCKLPVYNVADALNQL